MNSKKTDIEKIMRIVEEESLECLVEHDAVFEFKKYNSDIKTIFIRETEDSEKNVEFFMIQNLKRRLKELNPRYVVGIIYCLHNRKSREQNSFTE